MSSERPIPFALSLLATAFCACDSPGTAAFLSDSETDEHRYQPQPPPGYLASLQPPEPPRDPQVSDEALRSGLTHRLVQNGALPLGATDIQVVDGIVELNGSVLSLFTKRQVENIVRTTRGVRAYIDKLTVTEFEVKNERLEGKVSAALAHDAATDALSINVEAQEGVVTLSGTVDSWAEYALADDVAAGVFGVREVKNSLTVENDPHRPDHELEAEIQRRLDNDVLVHTRRVNVKVAGGVVQLDGIVPSIEQKARIDAKSRVVGVKDVTNRLDVQPVSHPTYASHESVSLRPDIDIRSAVADALNFDARVKNRDIEVHVNRGLVTLTGTVPSLSSKRIATETAETTLGVTTVRNYLSVKPEVTLSSGELKTRVLQALHFNPDLVKWEGKATVNGSVVTLSGHVTTPRQKALAEELVSRVAGVTHVDNYLQTRLQGSADGTLKKDVEEAILWDVYVDKDDVEVIAGRGTVTLTGRVQSAREYRAAEAAARSAGAEAVCNQLAIGPLSLPKALDPDEQ